MKPLVCIAFALATYTAALAQTNPSLHRVELSWPTGPTFETGTIREVVVGAFVPNLPAMCAVVLRGTHLFLLQQPGEFEHFAPAGALGVRRIATMPGREGRPSRLAALSPQGLHVFALTPTGFANANAGPVALPPGAVEVEAALSAIGGNATTFVLATAPTAVALFSVDANSFVTHLATWPAPPGNEMLDAGFVNWEADHPLEVALQSTGGLAVITWDGTVLATVPDAAAATAARIVALGGGSPGVVQLLQHGPGWTLQTAFPDHVGAGGTQALAQPAIGLAVAELSNDQHRDLIVSSSDSVRRVVLGTADGPSTTAGYVEVYDLDPLPAGVNLAPLVVADVEQDGEQDLVAAPGDATKVVVTPRIRAQLVASVWNGPPPQENDTRVEFKYTLGFTEDPADAALSPAPGIAWLGIRVALPGLPLTNRRLLASTYPVQMSGTPHVDDPVLLAPSYYEFTFVGNPDPTGMADIALPFAVPTGAHPERYVLEIRLVEETDFGYVACNTPRFLDLGLKGETEYSVLGLAELLTTEHTDGWWFDHGELPSMFGSTPLASSGGKSPPDPPATSPGNRFVGLMDIPPPHKKRKTLPTLPAPAQVTQVGPAATHTPQ